VFSLLIYKKIQNQSRIHEEIDRVLLVGDGQLDQGRIPCYATDAERMPWTEATICEVQRIKTILPLGVPHGTLDVSPSNSENICELNSFKKKQTKCFVILFM
jgi:hypothetical protein